MQEAQLRRRSASRATPQLKAHCLNFPGLLAQAVALISPIMTALVIPVMYSNTADWIWLPYALGTVMLLFVALNLKQFARRSITSARWAVSRILDRSLR